MADGLEAVFVSECLGLRAKTNSGKDVQVTASDDDSPRNLRKGFSTGTAMAAAACAALRRALTGEAPAVVAVKLPMGFYLPIPVASSGTDGRRVWASVVKDGGDDPDVTHRAKIVVSVAAGRTLPAACSSSGKPSERAGVLLVAGEGVGRVTKPGLPIPPGEPAVNPVPRRCLMENLAEEWRRWKHLVRPIQTAEANGVGEEPPWGSDRSVADPKGPPVWLPFPEDSGCNGVFLEVTVSVPGGEALARRTLNPRLGILGGISILGTTGIVRPFSHEAYEETIRSALRVARAAGATTVVLTTGGKSEKGVRALRPDLPLEVFVQVADFFAFSVEESRRLGFRAVVHGAFFGKVVKMAQGHRYTHAHRVPLDLKPLARRAAALGHEASFCEALAAANTARHALELLKAAEAHDVIESICRDAVAASRVFSGGRLHTELLLFDYDGRLIARAGDSRIDCREDSARAVRAGAAG
ncbi:MAG: cobalt-precorrin-5B (C(1))-methyltransferase CbiD [Thermodesulfobacteriota bacterium]|nr:cobalt-precorrin-5B (C(1))-methyltransferase CbiD [Thermodesulfobacteriota bacterium]